jgi:hypothetical protein
MKKTKSSLITTQVILSNEAKKREEHLSKCVLFDSTIIAITTRSEEIKKKNVTQQAKDKRIILKRNERINDEHDKYVQQQRREEAENENNRDELNEMKTMSEMNQSKKFQDFDDDFVNHEMMKYSKEKSMMISKRQALKEKNQSNSKVKIVKKQVKKLMILKKLKISNLIRVMKNRNRFDIQKMMNLMMILLMKQLLNESQQLRKKFV